MYKNLDLTILELQEKIEQLLNFPELQCLIGELILDVYWEYVLIFIKKKNTAKESNQALKNSVT